MEKVLDLYKSSNPFFGFASNAILAFLNLFVFLILRAQASSIGPFPMFFLNNAVFWGFSGYFEWRFPTEGEFFWVVTVSISGAISFATFTCSLVILFMKAKMISLWEENQWVGDLDGLVFLYDHRYIFSLIVMLFAVLSVTLSDGKNFFDFSGSKFQSSGQNRRPVCLSDREKQ